MKTLSTFIVLSFSLLVCRALADTGDYQGAEAILKQVEAQSNTTNNPSQKSGPVRQWREDLKRYKERAATLSPEEAAQGWLALFDRSLKLPAATSEQYYSNPIPLRQVEVFQALPPPTGWDALAAQIAARPSPEKGSSNLATPVLRIITGVLQNKPDAIGQAIAALKQQTEDLDGSQRAEYGRMVQVLQEMLFTLTGDTRGTLALFEAKLAQLQPGANSPSSDEAMEFLRMNVLEVPNLIALAGAPRAEALLKQMFALNIRTFMILDEDTKALARKVALEMGDRLKFAPWSLVDSLDSVPLYEMLDKQFPNKLEDQSERQGAEAYYLLGLITSGRSEEATKLAVKMGGASGRTQEDALGNRMEGVLGELAAKGYAGEVHQFFDRVLADHPELPYWHSYIAAAVLAGKTEGMLARVKAANERTDLKPRVKIALRHAYGEALLAADHVPEALPILHEWAVSKIHTGDGVSRGNESDETAQAVAKLAGIGRLLGDDPLLNKELDVLVELAKTQPTLIDNLYVPGGESLVEIFLAAKRGPEIERLLAASLTQSERALKESLAQQTYGAALANQNSYFRMIQQPLFTLMGLYYRTGRYEDIVALLNHANMWGEQDLAVVSVSSCGNGQGIGVWLQAARAIQKTGNPEAAARIVNAFLEQNGGSDPAYALLLELLPPDKAEARLNELFRGDQFEERPLIWRAILQLGQGRLDEAEKSARQAISIDPSDGEEGRGDRMRAYAVLGDILERKGDPEKAAQMRQAVQAIRLSEDADRFHAAGLLTQAVAMYEKALGYFSDAYCIQSRLAIQLTALGKLDEAMVHYERAYELMPESFGRLESHCFGCERAFAGKRAQGRAEQVFQKLVTQQPTNPRVHYLLGYLRMEEDRKAEAAREFSEAVKLDPDYINAWKQLAANTDDPAIRDRAELNLLRLDPQQKHGSADLSIVSDLRTLWTAVEAAEKFIPPVASSLYPLEASAAFLQQERERHPQTSANGDESSELASLLNQSNERLTPRLAILKNKVIAQALQLLPRNNPDAVPTL